MLSFIMTQKSDMALEKINVHQPKQKVTDENCIFVNDSMYDIQGVTVKARSRTFMVD